MGRDSAHRQPCSIWTRLSSVYDIWEDRVVTHQVSGKSARDARLVAAALAHGLRGILTLDKAGFARFPAIAGLHPSEA